MKIIIMNFIHSQCQVYFILTKYIKNIGFMHLLLYLWLLNNNDLLTISNNQK